MWFVLTVQYCTAWLQAPGSLFQTQISQQHLNASSWGFVHVSMVLLQKMRRNDFGDAMT